ncbi:MAG: HD domain-containing protein, partial [Armatimonadetes bacterium]|nr:HD domain-containing protein [Armatimonadota bacterium]
HPYTKGHLERVADLATEVAKELRLRTSSLMLIRDAGILHDIGKVGVSEEILDKEGKLTDEEWNIIKQHPARGAEIIAQLRYLEPIVPWVRGHHERPDGRGYPDALKDGQIPIEAAVIAVADAFDAMAGVKRSYQEVPLTEDQAIDQVRYGVGTQFDPRVVKAFLRVMARRREEEVE